jgi:hypothetical protein
MNFAPLYFDKVRIWSAPEWNMAYWNLHERELTVVNNKYLVNNKFPLTFYHFSGYNLNQPGIISKYQTRYSFTERPEMKILFDEYANDLSDNGVDFYTSVRCSFSGIKENFDKALLEEKINKIPFLKRIIRRVLLRIIRQFNIVIDYNKL